MPELSDIFLKYGPKYFALYGSKMLPSHIRAIYDIALCQTEYFGGSLVECRQCGFQHYIFHSCCNRNCPKCQGNYREKWLEKKKKEILPVTYFHVVFTVPEELRDIIRSNQKKLLSILMKTAAYSLKKLARDSHYIGGEIGLLCALHTWSQMIIYHPHVHCLVPAGAISQDGKDWIYARGKYLVPGEPLANIFRARFIKLARKALPNHTYPQSVWDKNWNVYLKPSVNGPQNVLNYLARYINRVAITNNRIIADHNGHITFSYKKRNKINNTYKWKKTSLPAMEFIRRFLQHVLPKGFHKIRSYGFFHHSKRPELMNVKLVLYSKLKNDSELSNLNTEPNNKKSDHLNKCPKCKTGIVYTKEVFPRLINFVYGRAPPCL